MKNKNLVKYLNNLIDTDTHKDIMNGTHRIDLSIDQKQTVYDNININKDQIDVIRLEETTNQTANSPHSDTPNGYHTMILPLYFIDDVYTLTFKSFYNGVNSKGYKYRPSGDQFYDGEWLSDDVSAITGIGTNEFDTVIYKKFLSYIDKKNFKGLTIDKLFKWKLGEWIMFPSDQLHAGSIFKTKKRWLTIHYMAEQQIKLKKFVDDGWNWEPHHGYPQDEFFNDSNTKFHECFDQAPQSIIDFAEEKFSKYTLTMMRQPQGQFIPNHKDKYYLFQKKYKLKSNKDIVRYCIFLEDWKPGHYLEIDGKPFVEWSAGDIAVLRPGIYHRSANAGTELKYTAQITGSLK